MRALVIYDSVFGNTEKIALSIKEALSSILDVEAYKVNNVKTEYLKDLDYIIVGSPTRAFKPTKETTEFLNEIQKNGLKDTKIVGFYTRMDPKEVGSAILKLFALFFGYAAKPIAEKLIKKGGPQIMPPEGFFVEGREGPLRDGEIEKAKEWAEEIMKK
jgi:flavodoxin